MKAANNGDGPSGPHRRGPRGGRRAQPRAASRAIAERVETYDPFDAAGMRPAALRALPPPRRGDAPRRRPRRRRGPARPARRARDRRPAARRRPAGPRRALRRRVRPTARRAPDERLRRERRELGIDHALVGAVLVRRWGLKPRIAVGDRAPPLARGRRTRRRGPPRRRDRPSRRRRPGPAGGPDQPRRAARARRRRAARRCVYEFPHAGTTKRRARPSPCPLSEREVDALRGPRRGQGLQADRPGAQPLGQHDPHPPPQRLPQDRRGRPRPGGPHRPRQRLDLDSAGCASRPYVGVPVDQPMRRPMATAWARSRAREAGEHGLGVGAHRLRAEAQALGACSRSSCRRRSSAGSGAGAWSARPCGRCRSRPPGRRTSRRRRPHRPPGRAPRPASSWRRRPWRPALIASVAAWRSGARAVGDDPQSGLASRSALITAVPDRAARPFCGHGRGR